MSDDVDTINSSYFVCIFNFYDNYKITKIVSKSMEIKYEEIENPYEKKDKTYLMHSILNIHKKMSKEIEIEFEDNMKEINTFLSIIEFEKDKSKFLYEIKYKSNGKFFQIHDKIDQTKHNFFKFNEFIEFINKNEYKEKREILKNSLIEDSIENYKKLKEKEEFEFLYLLLLMKESNNNFNFDFKEIKNKLINFPENINYIENIEDYKKYLLDNNFKNNDKNYKIIKFIFLWNYYKQDFINEFLKENFENNFLIFFENIDKKYIIKLNNKDKIENLNKILYKCDILKLIQLLKLFKNINDQINFIITEKEFINKNFENEKIILFKYNYIDIIKEKNFEFFLNNFYSLLKNCPEILYEINDENGVYDFWKILFEENQYNIKILIMIRDKIELLKTVSKDEKYSKYYEKCIKMIHDRIKRNIKGDEKNLNVEIIKFIIEDIKKNTFLNDNFYDSEECLIYIKK